jgi:MFS family permease
VLLLVSLAVLLASGTWFSGTAAAVVLRREWSLSDAQGAGLTVAVQLGFIAGTFLYALLNLADVFNARRVFAVSAVGGAIANGSFAAFSDGLASAVVFRFLTGLTLAGVYPVGMKIVASHFRSGLGWRLGVMVGALTLGTATPYLIQAVGASFDWRILAGVASLLAVVGAVVIVTLVPDGAHLRGRARFDPRMLVKVFRHPPFRYTAFGYFGHMWELYALWSLITFYLREGLGRREPEWLGTLPLLAFVTVGIGAVGCVAGGWVSRTVGERRVALVSMLVSGAMCAVSGFANDLPPAALVTFLVVWGFFVVSDSPQFSALAARYCPPEHTATALTVQNGVGFAITTAAIQLLPWIAGITGWRWAFVFLTAGPAVGAYFMWRLGRVDGPPHSSGGKRGGSGRGGGGGKGTTLQACLSLALPREHSLEKLHPVQRAPDGPAWRTTRITSPAGSKATSVPGLIP